MPSGPYRLPAGKRRAVAGGVVTVLGFVLLGVPAYDMWDDVTDLGWSVLTTFVENSVFIALAGALVVGGVWLARSDWEPQHVSKVARWTVAGWVAATVLFGWVLYLQHTLMGRLKPGVIAMNGVLIATVTTFGLGLLSARADIKQTELRWERAAKSSLESLHDVSTRLQGAEELSTAYDIGLDAVDELLSPDAARIRVDGETVAERTFRRAATPADRTTATAPIGERGQIAVSGEAFEAYDVNTLWLLGTHLDRAVDRISRERALREEREQFALINQVLRHELLNGLQIIQARLAIIEEEIDPPQEHWEVVVTRVDKLGSFVQQMRNYMHLLQRDDHELEPMGLRPTLEEAAATVEDTYTAATITVEDCPDVDVVADDLLGHLFVNLLRNAVEHNDETTPEIRVSGERTDGAVTVRVADNGPGIPDGRKEAVLELGEHSETSSGSGFGLYLVREVVDAYGGDVEIRDNDPKGTVVELTLPVAESS